MPNWCENDLTVSGKTEEIRKFQELVKSNTEFLDANKIIPYPDKYRELDKIAEQWEKDNKNNKNIKSSERPKDGFNLGGYEWCVENWGTKWGFCKVSTPEEITYDGETELTYHFETAWSPPKPLIKKMGEMFPTLDFDLRYFECGAEYNGILHIVKGRVIDDETAKYFGTRGG